MKTNLFSIRWAFLVAAALAASTASSRAQSATGTIVGVLNGSVYDYTVTLKNTGTANLESFWYGWTTSGNNLPSDPSNAGNSLGWVNTLDGNSIMFGNGSGTALTPGSSATFTFVSTSTPAQMTAGTAGESVAYEHAIDFSQGVSGDSTAEFSVPQATPEPSSLAILAMGLLGLGALYKSRKVRG